MREITVKTVIESSSASSPAKGLALFEVLKQCIERGESVTVSFKGVEELVTAFSNAAFGRLYMTLPKEILDSHLHIVDVNEVWLSKINLAIKLATNDKAREVYTSNMDKVMES